MALERVQKIIARAGLASRRKAEEFIRDGQVTINGKVAKLGDQAELNQPPIYVAFNKPRGIICTVAPDPHGRQNVGAFLTKIKTRVFPIGQMDFNSEGLMLLTNDGDFAEKLQKSDSVPRFYDVKVRGRPDPAVLKDLAKPMRLEGRSIVPHSVKLAQEFTQKSMIELVFVGWSAVDIKGFLEKKGFLVERIIRKAIGQLNLHGLQPGHYKLLKKSQVEALLTHPDLALRGIKDEKRDLPSPPIRRDTRIPKPLANPKTRWTTAPRGTRSDSRPARRQRGKA